MRLMQRSTSGNYKGREFYYSLIGPNNTDNRLNAQRNPTANMHNSNSSVRPELSKPSIKNPYRTASYAGVTLSVPNNRQH
jgi:hypothetical protein